jgi:hypothetical protein
MTTQEEKFDLFLGIAGIRLQSQSMAEDAYDANAEVKNIEMMVAQKTIFNSQSEGISLSITINYRYPKHDVDFFSITVTTEFVLQGLNKLKVKDQDAYDIPLDTLISVVSLALGHTRVYIAQSIAQSVFKKQISLPIFNPHDITEQLYPGYFAARKLEVEAKQETPKID